MLNHKLYTILSITSTALEDGNNSYRQYSVSISLNPGNEIFNGHFPGNPVLPGVCQVEMTREIAGEVLGFDCMLSRASYIKFVNMIIPEKNTLLVLDIKLDKVSGSEYDISATLGSGASIFMKMKGQLSEFKHVQSV